MKKSLLSYLLIAILALTMILISYACAEEAAKVTFISGSGISKLEAEDWIPGGQDISYHENSYEEADVYKMPSAGRPADASDVSCYVPQTNVTANGGYFLTYATDPEWLTYSIEVEKAGVYAVAAYAARGYDGGSLTLTIVETGEFTIFPYTAREASDWSLGLTKGEFLIKLEEGVQTLRLDISWPWDIDYFMFVPMADDVEIAEDPEPNLDPEYITEITPETCRIEMENWMNGSNGVAFGEDDYTDADTYAHPRAPRPSNPKQLVPQTRKIGEGEYVIIYMQDPDWMKFKISIEEPGTYEISARVGSNWNPGQISLYLDDAAEPFAILPASSLTEFDWTLQMTSKAIADLPSGEHILKVSVYGPFDIDYIELTMIEEE